MSTSVQTAAHLTVPVGARDHSVGSATAPVTLVEYGDYECPYCGEAHQVVGRLIEMAGPQVRFVFRHFPLATIHPHAKHAAEAAEAAAAQNNFWAMHYTLFEHQRELEDHHLIIYAGSLDLDTNRFADELAGHAHAPHVREDFMGGVRSGVNGTPAFYINGVRHDGAYDLGTLLQAVRHAV